MEITYKIKVVKVLGYQSPNEAIQRNPAWFEKPDIRTVTLLYPVAATKLESGKKYAWQIEAFVNNNTIGKSEVWSFIYRSNEIPEKIVDIKQCDVFNVELKKSTKEKVNSYNLLITNNYTGKLPGNIPAGFRITVKGDSVGSITGGSTEGWKRTPSKFPPGSNDVQWMFNTGEIPNGKADLGNIIFKSHDSNSIKVLFEWLDKGEALICKDSCTINESNYYYYELSNEFTNNFIEVPNNILNIQWLNNYASIDNAIINIYDINKYELVKPKTKKGDKSINNETHNVLKNFNGLNRISINIKDYGLQPKTTYLLTVSDPKKNYYLNFRVINENEK